MSVLNPFYSIIVPVFNTQDYLHRCLDSVCNQTFSSWECLIVDDGSMDESAKICDEYSNLDSRFKVFHKKNEGVSVARNLALKEACGEYIVFLDSDDWLETNMLQKIADIVDKKDEMVVIGIAIYDGVSVYGEYVPTSDLIEIDKMQIFPGWFNSPYSKVYSKKFLQENKIIFPEGISLAEDMFFSYLCLSKVGSIPCIKEPLYYYYTHRKDSACNTIDVKRIQDEIAAIKLLEKVLENNSLVFKNSILKRKVEAKMKFLSHLSKPLFKDFRETFEEVNHLIWEEKKTIFFYCVFHELDFFAYAIYKTKNISNRIKNLIKKLVLPLLKLRR